MSADTPQVRHPVFGPAREVDREWCPEFNAQGREVVTLRTASGATVRADAEELETPDG